MKYKKQLALGSFLTQTALLLALPIVGTLQGAGIQPSEPVSESRHPNIVLILIDDMGYGDIQPFGCTNCATPNLDRMASEGLKLTSFYAAPVCSASRASIQTGCYAPRVSIPGVLSPDMPVGLNPKEHTVAESLKAQGYATMCIGKWHLGDQPEFFPLNYGFDHYFGLPYSNDQLRPEASDGKRVIPLMRDNQVISLWSEDDEDQMTRLYTEAAVKFIQENRDHPFYLYLAHNAVHFPIHPGLEFRGKSGHGRYYDWVEEIDWSAGQVMETLRQLHLERNTLVFFTSDNGPWLVHGNDAGTAYPLYGGKGSTWEGGVRESTFAWWPGHIPAGRVSDAVCGEIDLLPTFVHLAGGTVPTDKPIDGVDMSHLLLGHSDVSPREAQYYYLGYKLQAVRSGPWKLALGPQDYSMGIKTGGVKEPGLRLYNLDTDIGERTNVAAQHPEVVQRLKRLADHEAATLCDGPNGPGIRPPGYVENPHFLFRVTPQTQKMTEQRNAKFKKPLED
jgi:arylsulfatase A